MPWIIVQPEEPVPPNDFPGASIVTAHCNCMAGLGETCSHAAAVSFHLAGLNTASVEQLSCTSMPSKWTVPTRVRDAGPVKLKDIDFGKQVQSKEYNGNFNQLKGILRN